MLPGEFAALEAAFASPADLKSQGELTGNQGEATMTEMPPQQFARTNGIRTGYHEAGPKTFRRDDEGLFADTAAP